VIGSAVWRETLAVVDQEPAPGKLAVAFDVSTDRSFSTITIGWQVGEKVHVRVSRHQEGDTWLINDLVAIAQQYRVPITYDDAGPARDVGEALRLRKIDVAPLGGRDFAAACARLVSGLTARQITHQPFGPLDRAAETATARSIGEAWAFARRNASVPICPITSAALAVWAVDHLKPPRARFKVY